MFDTFECRRLLSGVVTVTTTYGPNGYTLVKGDAAGNGILVEAIFANSFEEEYAFRRLTSYGSPLIVNGVEVGKTDGRRTAYNIDGPLAFDLGDGDDVLMLQGDRDNAFGDVHIFSGRGDDQITADGGFASLYIDSGAGDDRVTVLGRGGGNPVFGINPGGIAGDLEIASGQGKDRIDVLGQSNYASAAVLDIGGRVRISDNSGPTQVSIAHVRVKRAVTVALSRSNDRVTVASSKFAGETRFLTGDGNDVVRFVGKVILPDIGTAMQFGAGHDVFDAERYYADFAG